MAPPRALVVGTGVALAGALMGAVAGIAVVAIVVVSIEGLSALREPVVYQVGASFGAVCGAVLAPLAGFTILRHVPLWRLFADGALGTVIAGVAASLAELSVPAILAAGAFGFCVAGARLGRRTPRTSDNEHPA